MALVYQEIRAEAVCSLEQDVLVLLNDKSRMKGDLHVRFREKFEVKVLLLTRLEGLPVKYLAKMLTDCLLFRHEEDGRLCLEGTGYGREGIAR